MPTTFHDADLAPMREGDEPTEPVATTEAPADSLEPAAETSAEPVAASETPAAQPRDPKGRFAPKASDSEPASATPAEGDPAAAPPAPAPTEPIAALAPPAPPPDTRPFTFRANGQQYPVEGASIDSDGTLRIPPAQVGLVKQLLSEGVNHRQTFRQREQEFKQRVEEATQAGNARAEKYNKAAVMLWERLSDPNWVTAAAADPREIDYLRRELDLELKAADMTIPKAEPKQEAAPDPQAIEQAARGALDEELDDLFEGPEARTLFSAEERKQFKAKYQRILPAFFTERDGEILLDRHILSEHFTEELNARKKARDERAQLAAAARKNEALNAKPNVPSVVPAKGSPTPSETAPKKDRVQWAREHGFA